MINRFLFWLTARLPCRLIRMESGPYLERYYLGQLFGVTFYLHRFVSSDSERHVHNHPWRRGGALILTGGYIEERALDICPAAGPSGCWTRRIRRRWFNRVDANTVHRIHSAQRPTWTLFFHSPRPKVEGTNKGWGFFEQVELEHLPSDHPRRFITTFNPYPVSHGNWWETAPRGRDAGREPPEVAS